MWKKRMIQDYASMKNPNDMKAWAKCKQKRKLNELKKKEKHVLITQIGGGVMILVDIF